MGEGSSGIGPAQPADDSDDEATRTFSGHDAVDQPGLADPADPAHRPPIGAAPTQRPTYNPPYHPATFVEPQQPAPESAPDHPATFFAPQQPTGDAAPDHPATFFAPQQPTGDDVSHQPPTYVVPREPGTDTAAHQPATYIPPRPPAVGGAPQQPASDVVRYGPGVPASQAGATAEEVWRTGRLPEPPRRPHRLRRLLGTALTVIVLAAAGVVLFLRLHHAPFHVTGVEIAGQSKNGCGVNVTGRIITNGAAGTVSYQWVFQPQEQAPQPLSQSVVAGQHAVYVTVSVQGQGHGSASQNVTLQVLGPDQGTAATKVTLSC